MARYDSRITRLLASSKEALHDFSIKAVPIFEIYEKQLRSISATLAEVAESHSGSWAGWHASLYYLEFQRPPLGAKFDVEWGGINGIPQGWQEKTYEDMVEFIKRKHGKIDVSAITNEMNEILGKANDLKSGMVADLSFLRDLEGFETERQMLEQIEKMDLTVSAGKWVDHAKPKSIISRDTQALAQGLKTPPHVEYWSKIMQLNSTILSIKRFVKQGGALLRQIEVRLSLGGKEMGMPEEMPEDIVIWICDRFHHVAKQLVQRHSHRETLTIKDEYDVQDLLHALLLSFFDDVRREEYTPSYAGSSSRMDILLKVENTAVEVKYNLENKQLRDELIVDVATYKEHPDCKRLVCFVYDPHGKVKNPRGFESDLGKQSSEDLEVVVLVRPS